MLCKFTSSGLVHILVQAQVMIVWGFLDTLTKVLSTERLWLGSILDIEILKIKVFKITPFNQPSRYIVSVLAIYYQDNIFPGQYIFRRIIFLMENNSCGPPVR